MAFDEVNIYGAGQRNGKPLFIAGECKVQFGLDDVERFQKMLARLKDHLGAEIFPLALRISSIPKVKSC